MHFGWQSCMQCEQARHMTLSCVDKPWLLRSRNIMPCPTSGVSHAVLCKLDHPLLHPQVRGMHIQTLTDAGLPSCTHAPLLACQCWHCTPRRPSQMPYCRNALTRHDPCRCWAPSRPSSLAIASGRTILTGGTHTQAAPAARSRSRPLPPPSATAPSPWPSCRPQRLSTGRETLP